MSTDPEEHGPEAPEPAAPAAASANGPGPETVAEATSAELLGALAHELTSLLRTEIELNQCEHAASRPSGRPRSRPLRPGRQQR